MRTLLAATFLTLLIGTVHFAQTSEINIIPRPAAIERGDGHFTISKSTRIVHRKPEDRTSAITLRELLKKETGYELKIAAKPQKGGSSIFVSTSDDVFSIDAEYTLEVTPDQIEVYSTYGDTGLFYGFQSLIQILERQDSGGYAVPSAKISDHARFKYRGMHLDVARHFQPVEFVKKFIDRMAEYKFNTFHWHLTDDQGWRIEIKKWPRLTEVGSKRPETVKERNLSPYIGDGIPHGGFYTQEQIKDVVAYAKARHINVIPEIELPGHASAALAAYPQFGCKQDYQYKVQTTWGIFKEVFCPTEETFSFLEDVLTETIALFPDSPYIHIGGDEVLKDHWKESAFVQDLKKRENLKDELEVQSYFIRRIERFLSSKGKRMIGWDEILEGGLAPNATVMSWRGMRGGIEAAKSKHDVIMTPTDFVYFDYGQGDPAYEPLNIGSYVPLEKVYSFEPVPPELSPEEAKYVIGGQANIWTEYIKTPSHIEYMAFPRMLALSEVLWSRKEDRDFGDFRRRLGAHLPRLDRHNVNYRIPEPVGLENRVTDSEKVDITLTPIAGTVVIYTTDGSDPDVRTSEQYREPIEITLKEGEVRTLKTVVLNHAGRRSAVYAATIVRGKLREPVTLSETKPGVKFEFLPAESEREGGPRWVTGETRSILLNQFAQRFDLQKPFTAKFDGYFRVPQDGVYELQLDSTWDATLVLGGDTLIDDAGSRESKKRSVIVPLKAGLHKISLSYNHRGGDLNFRFRWGIKGKGLSQAYGGEFVH